MNYFLYFFSDLRIARTKLLDLLTNPNTELSVFTAAVTDYLSLLHGFLASLDEQNAGDSKLRNVLRFRWTNTLCGNTAEYVHYWTFIVKIVDMQFYLIDTVKRTEKNVCNYD